MPQKSAMRGVPVNLQTAAASGNGTVLAIPDSFRNHKVIIKWGAGTNAGAIQIESADDPTYTGTWGQVGGGPIAWSAASLENQIEIVGLFRFIRARISTNVTGGTVDVIYVGS